jgi:hypothetical protein
VPRAFDEKPIVERFLLHVVEIVSTGNHNHRRSRPTDGLAPGVASRENILLES